MSNETSDLWLAFLAVLGVAGLGFVTMAIFGAPTAGTFVSAIGVSLFLAMLVHVFRPFD